MEILTEERYTVPDDVIFVEHFEVALEDDGLHVRFKSAIFEKWVLRLADKTSPIVEGLSQTEAAFDLEGKPSYNLPTHLFDNALSPTYSLYPYNPALVQRDSHVAANLSFLLLVGATEGIDVKSLVPVSVSDAVDYYHCCLQGFQLLYAECLRPFSASSTLREVVKHD